MQAEASTLKTPPPGQEARGPGARPSQRRRRRRLSWRLALLAVLAASPGAATPPGRRPESHPLFQEGFRAFQFGNWTEAADRMLAAQRSWAEDGITTRAYDRWFEPYAPLYYLGRSLHALGCHREAQRFLERSPLCQGALPGRDTEQEACRALVETVRRAAARPLTSPPAADCARWAGTGGS